MNMNRVSGGDEADSIIFDEDSTMGKGRKMMKAQHTADGMEWYSRLNRFLNNRQTRRRIAQARHANFNVAMKM
jgi:hypothetical protein